MRPGTATFHGAGSDRFLIVVFRSPRRVRRDAVRAVLRKARASFEMSGAAWIIRTSKSPGRWRDRLREVIGAAGTLFVAPIEMGEYEAIHPDFRKWLRRYFGRSEDLE
jgi:hypothetical protein